jgi:uncharacterized membrane protein YraQ (UPF0718 family)
MKLLMVTTHVPAVMLVLAGAVLPACFAALQPSIPTAKNKSMGTALVFLMTVT